MKRPEPPVVSRVEPPPQPAKYAGWVLQMLTEYFDGDKAKAIDFMRAHAGVTVVVPIMPVIERFALEHKIVKEINRDPSGQTASRLASVHNLPRRAISKCVKRATGYGVAERRAEQQHCRHPRISSRFRFRI